MSGRRFVELLVLGGCGFILTQAILSLVLDAGDTPTDGNPLWRLVLSVSYLGVAMILLLHYRETLFVLRRNWFLVAVVLLALVSCFWAAMPSLVLRRSIAVLGTTLFGIALAIRFSLEDQLRFLSWLFRIITLLSLVCVVLLPSYGISDSLAHEWRGVFYYKNALGSVMAQSILVEWLLPVYTLFSKTLNRLAIVISSILLFFSGSLTPTVALAGTLLLIEIYKFATQRLRIPLRATVLGTLLLVSCGAMFLPVNSDNIIGALGRSSDLTGRTAIWSWTIYHILERPIWGYGYSGFWFGVSPESTTIDRTMSTMIMYSHNGYLEILLSLGVVGFVLALAFVGTGIKRAFYCSERDKSSAGLWPLAFLLLFILHNFGECTMLLQDLEWSVCVAIVIGTDPALFAPVAEQEEEILLVPDEEYT